MEKTLHNLLERVSQSLDIVSSPFRNITSPFRPVFVEEISQKSKLDKLFLYHFTHIFSMEDRAVHVFYTIREVSPREMIS